MTALRTKSHHMISSFGFTYILDINQLDLVLQTPSSTTFPSTIIHPETNHTYLYLYQEYR